MAIFVSMAPVDKPAEKVTRLRRRHTDLADAALLGATTLELFNLAVGPVRRRMVPVPGLLK